MHSEGISYKPRDGEVGVCPQQQTREMLGVVPGWVQQATRRKTAREPSTRRAPQKRRSEVRTMSHKVIFLGQGTTPARRALTPPDRLPSSSQSFQPPERRLGRTVASGRAEETGKCSSAAASRHEHRSSNRSEE